MNPIDETTVNNSQLFNEYKVLQVRLVLTF